MRFSADRVAQMVVFFLRKTPTGQDHYMKLSKLLYLADREAMARVGSPITFDDMYSMPFGPVLSASLNLLKHTWNRPEHWNDWISPPNNYRVNLTVQGSSIELDALNAFQVDILETIWARFGHMDRFDLSNMTHSSEYPEWQNPNGSRIPIDPKTVFIAVGKSADEADALTEHLAEQRRLDEFFAAL